jgi:hypothetical protein
MAAWFENVFGFQEDRDAGKRFVVDRDKRGRTWLRVKGERTKRKHIKGGRVQKRFHLGPFEILSYGTLADRVRERRGNRLQFHHIIGSTSELMLNPENQGAVFQVASQFNALEMMNPNMTPEHGVTIYHRDRTQGPDAAMACPAALVYRNYFLGNRTNLLEDVDTLVDNSRHHYWTMQNGYLLTKQDQLQALTQRLKKSPMLAKQVTESVKVAIHWNTETTAGHNVCQVFGSACPVAYNRLHPHAWSPFAQLVLFSFFESTLAAGAYLSQKRTKALRKIDPNAKRVRVKVFLVGVGTGAFGNPKSWLSQAIERACRAYQAHPLDVYYTHYQAYDPDMLQRGMLPL